MSVSNVYTCVKWFADRCVLLVFIMEEIWSSVFLLECNVLILVYLVFSVHPSVKKTGM